MKKTYNPFKMWTCYVGGITFVLIMFLTPPPIKIALPLIIISVVFGFLIGWVPLSLVRVVF